MRFLSQITADRIVAEPFPHVVIEDALDGQLFQQLIANYPPLELFTQGKSYPSNYKLYLKVTEILQNDRVPKIWRDYIGESLQPELSRALLRSIKKYLLQEYPDFERDFDQIDRLKIGVRGLDSFSDCDILIGSLFVIHTPVSESACVERGPHIKLFETLWLSYLFFRLDQDQTQGADFYLYKQKPGTKLILNNRQTVDAEILDVARVVPYRSNTIIWFLNTARSIQGVSARAASPFPYMCHHFTGYMNQPLFKVESKLNVRISRILSNIQQPFNRLIGKYIFKER